MVRLDVDDMEGYDKDILGVLLIFVNLAGVALVTFDALLNSTSSPLRSFMRLVRRKHRHNGTLKGITGAEVKDPDQYWEYVENLIFSGEEEAGWQLIAQVIDDEPFSEWVDFIGLGAEWRCSHGNGPIDQVRGHFELDSEMEDVKDYLLNPNIHLRPDDEARSLIEVYPDKNMKRYNVAKKMKFPFSVRDFNLEEWHGRCRGSGRSGEMIVARSFKDTRGRDGKAASGLRRRRAKVAIFAFHLLPSGEGGKKTLVTFIGSNFDMRGILLTDLIGRDVYRRLLVHVVSELESKFNNYDEDGVDPANKRTSFTRSIQRRESGTGILLGGGARRNSLDTKRVRPISGGREKKKKKKADSEVELKTLERRDGSMNPVIRLSLDGAKEDLTSEPEVASWGVQAQKMDSTPRPKKNRSFTEYVSGAIKRYSGSRELRTDDLELTDLEFASPHPNAIQDDGRSDLVYNSWESRSRNISNVDEEEESGRQNIPKMLSHEAMDKDLKAYNESIANKSKDSKAALERRLEDRKKKKKKKKKPKKDKVPMVPPGFAPSDVEADVATSSGKKKQRSFTKFVGSVTKRLSGNRSDSEAYDIGRLRAPSGGLDDGGDGGRLRAPSGADGQVT